MTQAEGLTLVNAIFFLVLVKNSIGVAEILRVFCASQK